MQKTESKNINVEHKPLDEKGLQRLDELMDEVGSSGEFLRIQDGQSQEITFDLQQTPGVTTRTIQTKEGEKEINRFRFMVYNPKIDKHQAFELSRKWVKRAIEAMKEYNTNTLVIKRKGSSMLDTEYTFLPTGLRPAL
jgi:hypothetical protein